MSTKHDIYLNYFSYILAKNNMQYFENSSTMNIVWGWKIDTQGMGFADDKDS